MSANKIDEILAGAKDPAKSTEPEKESLNWEKVLAHVQKVRDELVATFSGKAGHNPFLYIKEKLHPLTSAYEKGDHSKELYDKMLAMKVEPPTTDHVQIAKFDMTKSVLNAKTEVK